jgi:uncharacterized protein YlxP (DUF503 family)
MLIVAVARIVLDTCAASSLKEKRRIRLGITDRIRRKFPVAIAEIEENDNHSRLVLGLSVVSNSSSHAVSMIDSIVDFIDTLYLAPLLYKEREVFNLGALEDPVWDDEDSQPDDWEKLMQKVQKIDSESSVPGFRL